MSTTAKITLVALFALATEVAFWNILVAPLLSDYDSAGHLAYIYGIVHTGQLPDPTSGWSTFHPPFYYLVCTPIFYLLEPFGARATIVGIRSVSVLTYLTTAILVLRSLRLLGFDYRVGIAATALSLFLPAHMIAGTMVGNESLGIMLCTLTLYYLLSAYKGNHKNHWLLMSVAFGLALLTKYSAIWLFVPVGILIISQRKLSPYVSLIVALLIAAPVYISNAFEYGTFFPMTRDREPVKSVEAAFTIRPRELKDYIPTIPPMNCSVANVTGRLNRDLNNVWSMAYISLLYDSLGPRISLKTSADFAKILVGFGFVLLAIILLGFCKMRWCVLDLSLAAMILFGLATFCIFTWQAPTLAAAKGSYLLPLMLPGCFFFAKGFKRLQGPWPIVFLVLFVNIAAVCYTCGLLFDPPDSEPLHFVWTVLAQQLPHDYVRQICDFVVDK